jgi:hypothetical protein
MRKGLLTVFTAVCLFILAGCSKDKTVNNDPQPPQPAEETWDFSGDVSGSVTVNRDTTGTLSASGILNTTAGDTIIITGGSVSITQESVQLFLTGQNGQAVCSLAVIGAALEGAGSGTVFIDFKGAQANVSGTWTAVLGSGAGVTATAAMLSSTAGGTVPASGGDESFPYSLVGNIMMFTMSDNDTSYTCMGSILDTVVNTFTIDYRLQYEATANTLTFGLDMNDMIDQSIFEDPNAVVLLYIHYNRVGTGSGLVGTWQSSGLSYEVTRGNLTSEEIAMMEDMVDDPGSETLEITQSEIIFKEDGGSSGRTSWADDFIQYWNQGSQPYSALYDITVSKISDVCVMLEGNRTGEVVVIYHTYDYGTTYISSNYDHARHVYYENPESCPNDYRPSWYYTFLSGNSRGGILKPLKKAVAPKAGVPLLPYWPLR